jgi:two-component system response regulator FixJ
MPDVALGVYFNYCRFGCAMSYNRDVYLIDDDSNLLAFLLLCLDGGGLGVKSFGTAESFLSELTPATFGCAVVDLRLPEMDGLSLIKAIAARCAWLPVIVITAYSDAASAADAMNAGALRVVRKPFDPTALIGDIRAAMNGFCTAARLRAEAAKSAKKLAALSRREREVLDSFSRGLAIKEIARAMALSPKSVETYRVRLIKKLGARNAATLMRMALLDSLMEPSRQRAALP